MKVTVKIEVDVDTDGYRREYGRPDQRARDIRNEIRHDAADAVAIAMIHLPVKVALR